MLRLILTPALLVLLAPAAGAQVTLDEPAAKQLREQAAACSRAFIEGDYERLADYTHPKVVEMMGGREKMAEFVRKGVAEMKAEGFEPLTYEAGEPTQVLRVGRQTYAVIPTKLRMRMPDRTVMVSESAMIAVSADGGGNWKFVSGSSADPAKLTILFPSVAPKLKFPPSRMYPEEKAP